MNMLYVNYEKAQKYVENQKKITSIIRRRLKGGSIYETVKISFQLFRRHPDRSNFSRLFYYLSSYFIGDRAAGLIIKQSKNEEFRIGDVFIPQPNQFLFHWAPVDSICRIKKQGLVHGEKVKYVYITDDNEYFVNSDYFLFKVYQLKKSKNFVLLKIDGKKLSEKFKIFYVFSEHKFAVEKIPPEFIEFGQP